MEEIKHSTQDHLDIYDIKDNLVILKNGDVCAVLRTTAVNFDLLSEIEQDAIIAAFSMLLNSIAFTLQIIIRSKKLDITKYIEKVHRTEQKIKDPLLKHQAAEYKKFIQDVIETNEVLDKSFYVVIPAGSGVQEGTGSSAFSFIPQLFGMHTKKKTHVDVEKSLKYAQQNLVPKVEHVMNEFNRLRVQTKQLTTQELVELYFDIYNPSAVHGQRIRTSVEDYKTAIVNPGILEE